MCKLDDFIFSNSAPKDDTVSSGGLQLGGYENVQEKLRKERAEEYRKFLAEVKSVNLLPLHWRALHSYDFLKCLEKLQKNWSKIS